MAGSASALLLAAGMLAAAPGQAQTDVYLQVAPPAPLAESKPPPQPGNQWAPGYWRWNGEQHVWVEGHWIQAHPGFQWKRPHWVENGPYWHFVPGRWEPY